MIFKKDLLNCLDDNVILSRDLSGKEILRQKPQNDATQQGVGFFQHTLSRISNIRQCLMLKFYPLTKREGNNNVTDFSPFTSHVSQKKRAKRKAAFTLAEVLITLGIIGVVAAMTMPTLIEKHQKKVFVTKMKYTYSVVSNAFLMSQQEHGDPKDWDWGKGVTKDNTFRVVQTYIAPYLPKMSEGWAENSDTYYVIRLKNGITLTMMLDGRWDTEEEGAKEEAFVHTLYIIGSMKNKTSGLSGSDRDYSREDFAMVFALEYYFYKSDRLQFFNWGGTTRDEIKNNSIYACNNSIAKNRRLNCGALIRYDGWEIKDDYPW